MEKCRVWKRIIILNKSESTKWSFWPQVIPVPIFNNLKTRGRGEERENGFYTRKKYSKLEKLKKKNYIDNLR